MIQLEKQVHRMALTLLPQHRLIDPNGINFYNIEFMPNGTSLKV